MIDTVDLAGDVTRQRAWDNCFFADHAEVAGGHDFRPDRAARLRFRLEHKKLGFGRLRGMPSCVGCGRCLAACPVDIDLDRIAARIIAEFPS
jgi:sulfhydrogenase subunit beta (sulfur reductase)